MENNYHITKKGDEWRLIKENAERASKTFETKEDAVKYGIDFMNSNGGSLKIHKKDGTFEEERTYPRSADPRKTKG